MGLPAIDTGGRMQLRESQPRALPSFANFFPGEKLLNALDDSKVGVVICDRRMRYKALNKCVAEIHNVPIEAHLGHFFHEIIGNFTEKVVPLWEDVFSTGRPLHNLEVTGQLPKRTGVGCWIENLFPLLDDKGRVAQVGCFVIEITPPPVPVVSDSPFAMEIMKRQKISPLATPDEAQIAPLSPREREVVRLVAEGKSNKEISAALAISVRTVETYRARLMLKLHATSSVQLVHYAIRNGLVTI